MTAALRTSRAAGASGDRTGRRAAAAQAWAPVSASGTHAPTAVLRGEGARGRRGSIDCRTGGDAAGATMAPHT
eukprot:337926-Prymnesium_polylepis.1